MSDFRLPENGKPWAPRMIGVSREAIIRHAEQHPCPDTGDDAIIRVCPCGRTHVLCCPVCDEAVFATPMDAQNPCEHLVELCPDVEPTITANEEFRLPSSAKVQARERLLRDAERVRSVGKAWIADAMVIGATDALPEIMAQGIAGAAALVVRETERPPGWVVELYDETAHLFAYWDHMPSRSEASR